MSTERKCVCPSPDPRDCWTLRYYGIAGLGAPSREDDPEECECTCHADNYDPDGEA